MSQECPTQTSSATQVSTIDSLSLSQTSTASLSESSTLTASAPPTPSSTSTPSCTPSVTPSYLHSFSSSQTISHSSSESPSPTQHASVSGSSTGTGSNALSDSPTMSPMPSSASILQSPSQTQSLSQTRGGVQFNDSSASSANDLKSSSQSSTSTSLAPEALAGIVIGGALFALTVFGALCLCIRYRAHHGEASAKARDGAWTGTVVPSNPVSIDPTQINTYLTDRPGTSNSETRIAGKSKTNDDDGGASLSPRTNVLQYYSNPIKGISNRASAAAMVGNGPRSATS